eukprot:scaffold21187_cov89-Cyclotella_meneghiniana.AAC.2
MKKYLGSVRAIQQSGATAPNYYDTEEGLFSYASTDLLDGWVTHLTKSDRYIYNFPPPGPGDEFGGGIMLHQLLYDDCKKAKYQCIDSSNNYGYENIIKFRMPVPQYASWHIINGPIDRIISGSIMIKIYDCYRPMKEPEVTWFQVIN